MCGQNRKEDQRQCPGFSKVKGSRKANKKFGRNSKAVGGNSVSYPVLEVKKGVTHRSFRVHFSFHMCIGHLKPENFLVMSFAFVSLVFVILLTFGSSS